MNNIIEYVIFRKSDRPDKRLKAIFLDKDKNKVHTTHFGLKNGKTYIDHQDNDKRLAYLARHRPREDWSNFITSGSLSRYVLWSHTSLDKAKRYYAVKFGLKLYKD
jgi:Family of unknown function (DUF5754)